MVPSQGKRNQVGMHLGSLLLSPLFYIWKSKRPSIASQYHPLPMYYEKKV